MNEGTKVKVSKLHEFSKEDWNFDDDEYHKLLEHNNQIAIIDCLAVDNGDDDHDFNYYDVTFDDGYEIFAISGYHLSKIK